MSLCSLDTLAIPVLYFVYDYSVASHARQNQIFKEWGDNLFFICFGVIEDKENVGSSNFPYFLFIQIQDLLISSFCCLLCHNNCWTVIAMLIYQYPPTLKPPVPLGALRIYFNEQVIPIGLNPVG
jgi:hypothetical protein